MAETPKNGAGKKSSLIDPIYQKYTKSVIRALASTEFYDFFMNAIAHADNEFQFSNRKKETIVDLKWVDAIEDAIASLQNIISNPRNVIKEEEIIVNVAHAKKSNSEVVRHLAQHGSMVEDFDEGRGEVRPGKLMQKIRDDSTQIYENRLVFTVMEKAFHFVKIRHDALMGAMGDEFGAKLKMRSDMESATELVHMDMFLHIKEKDDILLTDEKNGDVFGRISRLYRLLSAFMQTQFAQDLSKENRIKGTVVKTNVLKRNVNYKAVVKLYEFLQQYDEIGYVIKITEQNPVVEETFEKDIYHNIMFNYIILKNYLDDESDRTVPTPLHEKKRTIKPKFIRQIIEELTEDYDLPDVEIRKVLIEELTKEQLMLEEAEERRRLVEEQEKRKKEEEERLRQEQEAELERQRREKEAEEERIRQEQEAEKARLEAERLQRELEDRRRGALFKKELDRFAEALDAQLNARAEAERKRREQEERAKAEYEEAARLVGEAAERRREEAERERIRREEERARVLREKRAAEAKLRAEIKAKEEAERKAAEEAQRAEDRKALSPYIEVMDAFYLSLAANLKERNDYIHECEERDRREAEERAQRRERRLAAARKDRGDQ